MLHKFLKKFCPAFFQYWFKWDKPKRYKSKSWRALTKRTCCIGLKPKQAGRKSFAQRCAKRNEQPRGIRNHNPLNIERGCNWQGACGQDGRFVVFSSSFHGIRAGARVMNTYRQRHGITSIKGIIHRWAPPADNNPTASYISYVCGQTGIFADTELRVADYPKVIAAMIRFENGQCPYSRDEINQAVKAGFA